MTAVTFPARIGRVDSAGNDPDVPRLVFGVIEDTSLHPVGAFVVSPATILALLRLEVAQVLKDEDARLMSLGELDNTGAHQMGNLLIHLPDLAPQVSIVLFPFCDDASLGSVTCNPS